MCISLAHAAARRRRQPCAHEPLMTVKEKKRGRGADEGIVSLKDIELFSSLGAKELRHIAKSITLQQYKRGQIILHEEETNEFMYIILGGEVKVVQNLEGKEIVLAIHHSGEFFGEMSLIDKKTIPAAVIAKTDCIVALISKEAFYSVLLKQSKVLEKLLTILITRFRESLRTIQILSFKNAAQRVKMLLILLSRKYGRKEDDNIELKMRLTHQDIAEMTGLTRESVTRVLDGWQKRGEIAILKDKRICLTPAFFKDYGYEP